MEKDYLIQLTNNLYRLTLLFPKKEPLRYKMRELADEILSFFLSTDNPLGQDLILTLSKLEVLDGFFEIVRAQNWLKSVNLLILQKEYQKIKEELKGSLSSSSAFNPRINGIKKKEVGEATRIEKVQFSTGAKIRQEKILEILREKGRAQVWEIKDIFPGVSKRTLRRDFESLLKRGMVERIGENNNTFYRLKIGQA